MSLKSYVVFKILIIRIDKMRDKMPYHKRVGVSFSIVAPASSIMPIIQYKLNQQLNE